MSKRRTGVDDAIEDLARQREHLMAQINGLNAAIEILQKRQAEKHRPKDAASSPAKKRPAAVSRLREPMPLDLGVGDRPA